MLASSREEMALRDANVTILCNLVLEWIHRNWEPAQLNVDQLTAKVDSYFCLIELRVVLRFSTLLTDALTLFELGQFAARLC